MSGPTPWSCSRCGRYSLRLTPVSTAHLCPACLANFKKRIGGVRR